jgi:hypothetical protein
MPIILATWEAEMRRIEVEASMGKWFMKHLSQKYSIQKRFGGVVQMVEHLPSKCEVLSSNPSPKKTNQSRTYWRFVSSGRLPALKARGP